MEINLPILDSKVKTNDQTCGCHTPMIQDRYWRSLDELADSPDFQQYLKTEFPTKHELWDTPINRRDFLKIMGASVALAAFAGCRKPMQKIFPYTETPETLVPGKPLFFASTIPFAGYGMGVLVESHEGRPTKIEGNPNHPTSLGASNIFMHAAVLALYDPDRSQSIQYSGMTQTWEKASQAMREEAAAQVGKQGSGLRILTETITSPLIASQMVALQKKFPSMKWHQYDSTHRDAAHDASIRAFGRATDTHYKMDQADVVLSIDGDFMTTGPSHLRYARDFVSRRKVQKESKSMNRLYVVESTPSMTGGFADHRLPLSSDEIDGFTRALARTLGVPVEGSIALSSEAQKWVKEVASDLSQAGRRALVLAGDYQPASVHILVHAINDALSNAGTTVYYTTPVEAVPSNHLASLKELCNDIDAGKVDSLFILGGNPLYTAPSDLNLQARFDNIRFRMHLSPYEDETSMRCHWHIPQTHPLESWGDLRAADGTVSLQQPLIAPLYEGKTPSEFLSVFLNDADQNAHDLLKEFWSLRWGSINAEKEWKIALHDGVVVNTVLAPESVSFRTSAARSVEGLLKTNDIDVIFRPDPTIWDGQYANNGWLQELPKGMAKLTWDNAAIMSPSLAEKLKVKNEDFITLSEDKRSLKMPVWILPGQATNTITLHLGYGRTLAGSVGNQRGFNITALRQSEGYWQTNASAQKTSGNYRLACTQHHNSMEGRDIIREITLTELLRNPQAIQEKSDHDPKPEETLYSHPRAQDYAWGMTIDLNSCIGCNACVTGCQSENNIPVVGKEQVLLGREMQWIRVDRYFNGNPDDPEVAYQPVACVHCENAPCEPVCPVGATVHSDEGLNEMVYNRCIGTRYCSNNCPYKVRRFNFLQYADTDTPSYKLMNNPNVTVRARGVMEKCTYCVQRINAAKIEADKEDRLVRDGEIITACQAACPTQAIVFGNLNDKGSRVSKIKEDLRNYGLLADLGTHPRTTYLAKVRNPNPALS